MPAERSRGSRQAERPEPGLAVELAPELELALAAGLAPELSKAERAPGPRRAHLPPARSAAERPAQRSGPVGFVGLVGSAGPAGPGPAEPGAVEGFAEPGPTGVPAGAVQEVG